MKKLLALLVMSALAWAAPLAAQGAGAVKIGLLASLTGQYAAEGKDLVNVVQLLAEQANQARQAAGQPAIELVVEDDASDPAQAPEAAKRLVKAGVAAVIGSYASGVTAAAQPVLAEAKIPHLTGGSTSTALTEKGLPLFFRLCPRDDSQSQLIAASAARLGRPKVALLHDGSGYGQGFIKEMQALLGPNGLQEVYFGSLTPGAEDYGDVMAQIKEKSPDIIIYGGYYQEAGVLLRARHKMGWGVDMISGDSAGNVEIIKVAGLGAAAGFYFVGPEAIDDMLTPITCEFLAAYQARYQAQPASVMAIMAGDAFLALNQALENVAEPTGDALARYLHNGLKGLTGFSGPITFNDKGDRNESLTRLYQVDDDGHFLLAD